MISTFILGFLWERIRKVLLNILKSFKLLGAGAYQMNYNELLQDRQATNSTSSQQIFTTHG